MLRAGALYFAIVIAFFIAVVSASLIMLAAHYRNSYLKVVRYQRLVDNLESGMVYVLKENQKNGIEKLDLYGFGTDSISINRDFWGIYELVEMRAFIERDTIESKFLLGKLPDSITLYLSDEDRPLSISGGTRITGNIMMPKSGLRQAYAEGKPYTGDRLVYEGKIKDSKRELSGLDEEVLSSLRYNLEHIEARKVDLVQNMQLPFGGAPRQLYLGKDARLDNVSLSGKIVLTSDSLITIGSNAKLSNVQVYAPKIKVEKGFKGRCQLFASDSLLVSEKVAFDYPSVIGLIRTSNSVNQPQLLLGKGSSFAGTIFSFEKERTSMQTMVSLEQDVKVKGEVFCAGLLKLEKGIVVNGKVSCNRFIMQTAQTLYENFLIDVAFNGKARSKYYLTSPLFGKEKENKVLQWLD